MLRSLVLTLFVVGLPAGAETSPLALSHFADGGGWKSQIAVFNTFGVDFAHVVIQFRGSEGQKVAVPLGQYGTVSSLDVELGTQRSLFLETSGTGPEVQTGWVEIIQISGSTPVRAYAVFRQTVPGRPDYEAVAAGMRAAASITFPFDNTEGLVTGFAVVNLGVSGCTVGVFPIFDEAGNSLASQPKVAGNLGASGHTAFVATDRIPELAGKRGYLKLFPLFGCSGGIAALGLRFNPTGPFTNLQPLSAETPF